jgi:hypothetical protein
MSSNEPNDPLAELLSSYRSGGTRGGVGLADLLGALTQGGAMTGQAGGTPEAGGLAGMLGQMSQAGDTSQVGGGQPGGMPQQGDALGQILGSLLGGGTSQGQASQMGTPQEAGNLGDVLGAVLGGGMSQGQASQMGTPQEAGNLGDVLGAVLGGGMQGSAPSMGAQMGASQGTTGIGDILGAVLGGGSSSIGTSPLLAPIANLVSQKLGLPPAIAQAVIAFVLAKLLSGSSGGGSGRMGVVEEGPGMQDLLERAGSGQRLDKRTLAATGLPEELAQHTGLDPDTAAKSLQQVLTLLGPAMSDLGAAQ